MGDPRILVVGAGLAGLAAAAELACAGHQVLVVDQARQPGGAVHRQPLPGARSLASPAQARRWRALMADVDAQGARIEIACNTRFGGVDHTGTVLLTGDAAALLQPQALVLAVGAREKVQPRPGWTLPWVTTAGALQVEIKTTSEPPAGRVLLAGSGPLLLALGAELVRLGQPPVAIIEAARPFSHPLQSLALPPPYMVEAARHLARLVRARVPVFTGAALTRISEHEGALLAEIATRKGSLGLAADRICLHDGIRPNDTGLTDSTALPVLRLGDCREALGAAAALADGRAGGAALAARLAGLPAPAASSALAREALAQARLARIYAHDSAAALAALPADTVICRCENRTRADLDALGPSPTTRQLRLDGRFGMGACQGRFCADWVARLARPDAPQPLGIPRWPARPISVAELLAAPDLTSGEFE
ncbi:MAG: FAD-dependent oxidoreductase [Phaeovulum sp.]|uniref:FAD-dependent oxidoreductase n=1 Tax=Phaeovulum sp. TaxID=2934796 RepID=UPI00272F4497|nr:FAD-dependent oxidoreductase [Phaeovulum sp.]MDP2062660.1 FAD-dependent oxidoreductase [Phaeovulum sp.]